MFIIIAIGVAYCLLKAESNDENPDNRVLIQETFEQIYDFFRRRAYQQALLEYQYRYELQQQKEQQKEQLKDDRRLDKRKKRARNAEIDRWVRKQMVEAKMELTIDDKKQPNIQIRKPQLGRYVQSFIGDVASTAMRRPPKRPPRRKELPVRPIEQVSSVESDDQLSDQVSDQVSDQLSDQVSNMSSCDDIEQGTKPKTVVHYF